MLFRGVILEGCSHAGKTSILKALKRAHASDELSERSLIVLGEHYSQILNNVHGEYISLSQSDHLHLLKERTEMLYKLLEWSMYLGSASKQSRGLFFVLERFHLNHLAAFGDSAIAEIRQLENKLSDLGAKCILLTISEEVVQQRIQKRNPSEWAGKGDEELFSGCANLISSQNLYRKYSRNSLIETVEMNTDREEWDIYASKILHARGNL